MADHRTATDGGATATDFPAGTALEGGVALVAGGTDGIGRATATRLAGGGATTVLVGSTRERGERAVEAVAGAADSDAVEFRQADLSRTGEVRDLAGRIRERYDRLDAIVLTAGVVPSERVLTDEGIERSFAINYLSRFLLTNLLLDRLRESAPARVVNVAAAGANPVGKLDLDDLNGERLFRDPEATDDPEHVARGQGALDQAQVANDLFTYELAERLAGSGVGATAVHPGAVDTDIRLKAGEGWRRVDETIREEYGVVPPETVAETTAPLATAADPGAINGRFFEVGREAVPVQEGVRDPERRERLWKRSAELAGLERNG
jgi:NAD(P)-dependent dehydrogenase (short-subunit alcohol dehydrogenase family)